MREPLIDISIKQVLVSILHVIIISSYAFLVLFVTSPKYLVVGTLACVSVYILAYHMDGCILSKNDIKFAGKTPSEIMKEMLFAIPDKLTIGEWELMLIGLSTILMVNKLIAVVFFPDIIKKILSMM